MDECHLSYITNLEMGKKKIPGKDMIFYLQKS